MEPQRFGWSFGPDLQSAEAKRISSKQNEAVWVSKLSELRMFSSQLLHAHRFPVISHWECWHGAMRFQTKLHFALLQFTWLQLRSSCAIQSRIAIAAIAIEQLLNSLNSYSALCVFALQNRKTLWRFKSLTVHCITQELSHQLSERTLSLNSWTPHVYSSVFWVDSVVNDFFSVRFCKTVKGQVFWENELDLPRCSEHSLNSLVCTEWQGDCAAHAAHAKVLQPDPCRQPECFVSLSAKFNTKSSCQLFHFPAADFAILCNPTTYWLVWPRLTLQPTAALNSKAFLWKLLSVTRQPSSIYPY